MSLLGIGQGINSGIAGANNMTQAQINQQNLQEMLRQAAARAQAYKLIKSLAAIQQGQNPGVTSGVMPSGVSPSGGTGGMPPAGAPMAGGGIAGPASLQDRVIQAAAGLGGDAGTNYGAFENVMKVLNPTFNQANRLQIEDVRQAGREKITQENIQARAAIEQGKEAARRFEMEYKASRDPQKLVQAMGIYQRLMTSDNATDEERKNAETQFVSLQNEYNNRRKGAGLPPREPTPTVPDRKPADTGAAGGTNEVSVISPDGVAGTIPASQLQDALAAGYKQP